MTASTTTRTPESIALPHGKGEHHGECASKGEHYNECAARGYKEHKKLPARQRIELYTSLQLVGDATGKKAVDVATGTGWLARELKRQAGADYVQGTDLSPEMIKLAKQEDDIVDYVLEDGRDATEGDFDIVTSNWLLVNAKEQEELTAMCDGLGKKAKSGGKLVTVVLNPKVFFYHGDDLAYYRKYGFSFVLPEVVEEGATMVTRCYTPAGKFAVDLDGYYHSEETYTKALEEAGFKDVVFQNPQIQPNPSGVDDSEFWREFEEMPFFVYITATKK